MLSVYDTDNALSEQHTHREGEGDRERKSGINECTSKRNRKKNGTASV